MPGEGRSDSASAAPIVSMDMGSVLDTPHSSSDPFSMPSTITQLQHKLVHDIEVLVRKTAHLHVK